MMLRCDGVFVCVVRGGSMCGLFVVFGLLCCLFSVVVVFVVSCCWCCGALNCGVVVWCCDVLCIVWRVLLLLCFVVLCWCVCCLLMCCCVAV